MPKSLLSVFAALALSACAAATPRAPSSPSPAVTLGDTEVAQLTDLMRFEDVRSFDAVAFNHLAASPSAIIRARTMLAAGRIKDHAAVDLLIAGTRDPVPSVRAEAAFALGQLADTSAQVVQALGSLSAMNGEDAAEALAALGKIAAPAARPYVEQALQTRKSGPELQAALLAAWRFPRQASTAALIRAQVASPDAEIRWRAVYALTRVFAGPGGVILNAPDPANIPAFRQWLSDKDPVVRSFAVRGLRAATADSAGQRDAAAAALIGALRDSSAHVRINALGVLGGYRQPAHASAVAPLLTDRDLNVRIAAAQALGLMKGAEAGKLLDARVNDATEHSTIRGVALTALATADPATAILRAGQLAASGDLTLRTYAARALGSIRTREALNLARAFANDPDFHVVVAALGSVSTIAGDTLQGARALFIEKLGAANTYVRAAALGGLQNVAQQGDESFAFEALDHSLRDSVENSVEAAITLLGKLATTNPAVQRTFATRFPIDRIPFESARRTAVQNKLAEGCCTIAARPDVYAKAVTDLLLPAIRGAANPRARFTTAGGTFEAELLAGDAPLTVRNFVTLAERGYFNGTRWHRVVPNFVLQDGDPTGTGEGGPGYAIRDEINRVRYLRGAVGMALSGPDTGGSQYFITHSPQPHLDGGYTIFGRVVSGMGVADSVIQDDVIVRIEILR